MQIAGAALGGVLGAALGLRVMLSSAGWGLSVVTLLLALSPIRRIRDLATTRSPRSGHEHCCLFCRFQAIPGMAILRARYPSFFISKHRRHRFNPHIPSISNGYYRLNV